MGREPSSGAGHVDRVMEPLCRRDLERGLLFRLYMEPYGMEG